MRNISLKAVPSFTVTKPAALVSAALIFGGHYGLVYSHEKQENLYSNVESSENVFWANRLGGGREDVFISTIENNGFTDLSMYGEAKPINKSDGTYYFEINADQEAYISHTALSGKDDTYFTNANSTRRNVNAFKSIDSTIDPALRVSFDAPIRAGLLRSGSWRMYVNSAIEPKPIEINHENSSYGLSINQQEKSLYKGKMISLSAYLTGAEEDSDENIVRTNDVYRGESTRVTVDVLLKDEVVLTRSLVDWKHSGFGRGVKNGIYSGKIYLGTPGDYKVKVHYKTTIGNQVVERTSITSAIVDEARFKVVSGNIDATTNRVLGKAIENNRYGLPLVIEATQGNMPEFVNIRADVWAKDRQGNDSVVGWTGGMVQPTSTDSNRKLWSLPFTFHSGWLVQDDYYGPLSLRNISVTSISTGDELAWDGAKSIVNISNIDLNVSRTRNANDVFAISDNMQRGVHPSSIGEDGNRKILHEDRVQTRHASNFHTVNNILMISGFNAGPKAEGGFNAEMQRKMFQARSPRAVCDTAQQKSIEVMNGIGWAGNRIRGIVAHSHGGLVAAELLQNFSYIFFDDARSLPVNVMTNGSPFNGSWLGDRSTSSELYQLFGGNRITDCSVPYDLRRSQNSRWRQRIGSRARKQIYSYYTHTEYSWGICNVFTSPIISGKDDGTIQPRDASNFATGGIFSDRNWCHSSGSGWNYKNQWRHPNYIQLVNGAFAGDHEVWQPF